MVTEIILTGICIWWMWFTIEEYKKRSKWIK